MAEAHLDSVEPFLIRGHHATSYWRLLHEDYTPQSLSDALLEAARTYVDPELDSYFADVYGKSTHEITRSSDEQVGVFERFLNLAAETPVHFIANQRDNLCNICTIGLHCAQPATTADERGIRALILVARVHELDDEITSIDPSLPPEKGLSVPADVAQFVLSLSDYGAVFDAISPDRPPERVKSFLTICGMPEYYDLIVEAT